MGRGLGFMPCPAFGEKVGFLVSMREAALREVNQLVSEIVANY